MLSRRGRLAGDRRAGAALARRRLVVALRLHRRRDRTLFLDMLETGTERPQTSLQVVNPVTEDARTALLRPAKPLFEGRIGVAQHGLHPVGTAGAGHNTETGSRTRACSQPQRRSGRGRAKIAGGSSFQTAGWTSM